MKFFIDTEFKEYHKQHRVLSFPVGYPTPTIDLISIGIAVQRWPNTKPYTYYALNKECHLHEVWADKWLQENVMLPIYQENVSGDARNHIDFTFPTMKSIFQSRGKTKEMIANNIVSFVRACQRNNETPIEFYGYYSDYDWVVFCQLFGTMMDLPVGFPMYCVDLKQIMDEKGLTKEWKREYCPESDEHNALSDALWNAKLFNLMSL